MSISYHAYYTVRDTLHRFLAPLSKPQRHNVSLFVYGLFAAGNCQLPRIAAKLPLVVGAASITQRLERLLKNPHIQPAALYKPVTRFLLSCFSGGSLRLIMDATDLGDRFPMLFVAVVYHGRALPLAWRMLPQQGCSTFAEQKALLTVIASCLADIYPKPTQIVLLADREYGSAALIRWCHRQGWHFCLRMKKNRWFTAADGTRMQMQDIPLAPGERAYRKQITLPDLPGLILSLSCAWSDKDKDDEPWYILSDLPAGPDVLTLYAKRFSIEEMFRDFKEQGFRLETTHLRTTERVARLVFCVCLAYVWLLQAGLWVCKRGWRRRIDRHAKRQLSYFQIGWRYLQQAAANGSHFYCKYAVYT
jgi:hypothetical protein